MTVATIIRLLENLQHVWVSHFGLLLLHDNKFYSYASNLPIQAAGTGKNYFNADCTVMTAQAEKVEVLPG